MKTHARRLWLYFIAILLVLYCASSALANNGQEYLDKTGQFAVKEAPIKTSDEKEQLIWIEDLKTPDFSIDKKSFDGCGDKGQNGSQQLLESEPKFAPPQRPENQLNQQSIEDPFLKGLPEAQLDYALSECLPALYKWLSIPPGHSYLTQWPVTTVGFLLADTAQGTIRCSAAVIQEKLVLTAGHCVSDGAGRWYSNFRFFPATQVTNPLNTSRAWNYSKVVTFSAWLHNNAWCRDVAMLVMQQKSGKNIGQVYGWLGFAYGYSLGGKIWTIFGYPSYRGYNLLVNQTPYFDSMNLGCSPYNVGVSSNHNKGSSGGPWVLYVNDQPYANSVNSSIIPACTQPDWSTALFGPYFDKYVWDMYLAYK